MLRRSRSDRSSWRPDAPQIARFPICKGGTRERFSQSCDSRRVLSCAEEDATRQRRTHLRLQHLPPGGRLREQLRRAGSLIGGAKSSPNLNCALLGRFLATITDAGTFSTRKSPSSAKVSTSSATRRPQLQPPRQCPGNATLLQLLNCAGSCADHCSPTHRGDTIDHLLSTSASSGNVNPLGRSFNSASGTYPAIEPLGSPSSYGAVGSKSKPGMLCSLRLHSLLVTGSPSNAYR